MPNIKDLNPAAPAAPGNTGGTILVVDDSRLVRMIISAGLTGYGFHVIEAGSGSEALQILQRTPDIKLVTLDVTMPGMNGFELLSYLQEPDMRRTLKDLRNDGIPVVIITAHDTEEDRLRGFTLGAVNFVTKAEARTQLLDVVKRILMPSAEFLDLTVLVADDSAVARRLIVACLREIGVRVVATENGAEAWDVIRQKPEAIDLVLTDLHMPVMEGDELCRMIRENLALPDLPIIVLSGTATNSAAIKLFKLGATDCLRKPFIKEELTARLTAHLKQRKLTKLLKDDLQQIRRLSEMKDQFLAVCSHDLRSPLVGIVGISELLLEHSGSAEDDRRQISQIQASGHLLLDLINNILDLGRLEGGRQNIEMAPLSLAEIVWHSIESLEFTARGKGVALTYQPQARHPVIRGNRTALARVFNNLLSNAIKFTRRGGAVTACLLEGQDGSAVVRIVDTGIGIPQAMIPRLFERYSRSSRSGTAGEKGTGLGMTITKEIIEQHGGTIQVESLEGLGTTMTLTFPTLAAEAPAEDPQAAAPQAASAPPPAAPARTTPLRVLLAEDNLVNRSVMEKMLAGLGCQVCTAADGEAAAAAFAQALPTDPFDLVLMDVEMPLLNGLQATQRIRAAEQDAAKADGAKPRPPVRIMALTAHTTPEEHEKCRQSGMDEVLVKPVRKDKMRALLAQWPAPA